MIAKISKTSAKKVSEHRDYAARYFVIFGLNMQIGRLLAVNFHIDAEYGKTSETKTMYLKSFYTMSSNKRSAKF